MNKKVLETKTAIVQEVTDSFKEAQAFVVCEYSGLTVKEISELRKSLREKDAKAAVYKNTLVTRALAQGNEGLDQYLTGANMYFFLKDSTNGSLNLVSKFAKKHDCFNIKGGVFEGKVVDANFIKEVANLPSKEGLVSMLLSVLQAPMRNLAYSLSQVAEKK